MPERSSPPSDPGDEQGRGQRPGSVRIGRIAGADVLVSSSWFLVAALIAFIVAPSVEVIRPGLGSWKYVAGLAFAVMLYLALLLHEASHAVIARRYGYNVKSITLHFLGGMTEVEGEVKQARQEFWIAVVGPLTSIAVGLVALGLWGVLPEGLLRAGAQSLAILNIALGVLNLLPGLPFDGGRVLRSVVWGVTGSPYAGSVVAAWGGRLIAVAVLALALLPMALLGTRPSVLNLVVLGVLSLFLWNAASASLVHARMMSRLPRLAARPMARRTTAVPADLPLSEAVRRAQEQQAGSIITLDTTGAPVGLVNESALLAVPADRRPWMPVSAVARQLSPGLVLPADLEGEELIRAIGRNPSQEYLLVETDGKVHGVLSAADVNHAYRGGAD